jgi:hypothetical protein
MMKSCRSALLLLLLAAALYQAPAALATTGWQRFSGYAMAIN